MVAIYINLRGEGWRALVGLLIVHLLNVFLKTAKSVKSVAFD